MQKEIKLGNRVQEIRSRLKIRQSDLAREVGISRQSIISIEKGRMCPSVLVALKIARVLREPIDYVFYLDSLPEKSEITVSASSIEDEPTAVWDF